MVSVYSANTNETGSKWSRVPESDAGTARGSRQEPAASSSASVLKAPASTAPISDSEYLYYYNNQGLENFSQDQDPVEARTQLRALKEQNYYKKGGTVPLSTNDEEKDQQLLDWDVSLYHQTGGREPLSPDLETAFTQIEKQRREVARKIREAHDRRGSVGRRRR